MDWRLTSSCLLLLLVVVIVPVPGAEAKTSIHLEGFVSRADGTAIQSASIRLWGFSLEAENSTDDHGYYSLRASTDELTCTLYAFYDDPETLCIDFLPAAHNVDTGSDVTVQVNFTLVPAATVIVAGRLRPIESVRDVRSYTFEVVKPETGAVIRFDDYTLLYGTGMNVRNFFLGLNSSTIVVPAGVPFAISVSSSYQYERSRGRRGWHGWSWSMQMVDTFTKFDMIEDERFLLGDGELLRLDIRKYSLQSDLGKVEALTDELQENITAIEAEGFYITSERYDLHRAKELTRSSAMMLAEDAYEEAYIDLRRAYLLAVGLRNRLATMATEASASVNTLIAFIAMTAVASASLLSDKRVKRLLLTAGLYAPMLLYLYHIYPGSYIVSRSWFIAASAISVIAVLLASNVLPKFLKDDGDKRGIARLGALVAVFSMAERNLKRRKLRFSLTLTSILILTMSFVALTSYSTGYGLVYAPVPNKTPSASGIMIRMSEYKPKSVYEEGWFYPLNYLVVDWADSYPGVASLALKAENTPRLRPYANIGRWPIYGILGVQPGLEPSMRAIDESVVEGDPLRDDGTCLLNEYLLQGTNIGIGDSIVIRGVRLLVVGAFSSRILQVRDMDGESILPKYQINLTPGAEIPIIEAVTCETHTVVVTTLNTALSMEDIHVSRIDVELEPSTEIETLMKSMALSREYRFWASVDGDVHLAHMGSLVEGKGLPILVPWLIVILNVVATMLNAMFERRREISILSSIGLNPVHISGIFLAEASIIGTIGGGFGYLLGMGWYPLMGELASVPIVRQKVSASWCFAALGIAIAAMVFGSLIALKRSVVVTPSLKRRWALEGMPRRHDEPWTMPMPLKVEENQLNDFIDFITSSLERYDNPLFQPHIEALKMTTEERKDGWLQNLSFRYSDGPSSLGGLSTYNTLNISKTPEEGAYTVELSSKGTKDATHKTGTFIRKLIITWTTERRQQIKSG